MLTFPWKSAYTWPEYHKIFLMTLFLFLIWANMETPFWADDYCRIIPVSLSNPIILSYNDYFNWTGRFFTTAITYYVLSMAHAWTKIPFDIINATIFFTIIFNILSLSRLAAGEKPGTKRLSLSNTLDIIFVFLALWWLPRTIAEVALWKTGSIGYSWPVAGELWIMRLLGDAQRLPNRVR